MYTNRRSP